MSMCWPGQCPDQFIGSRMMLFTRLVSVTRACTRPTCHSSLRGVGCASVAVIPLLLPGIAIVVISARLPEAGLILGHEAKPPQPLGALPKVEMRDQEAGWASMSRSDWQALVTSRNHSFSSDQIGNRDVRGVAAVAVGHDKAFRRLLTPDCS